MPLCRHRKTSAIDPSPQKASSDGDIMAIIVVLQLPPRLSSSILVSLESLRKPQHIDKGTEVVACQTL